ncbi:MAG: 2-phosphosulfolactate phosphatase [Candidatus Bathyarchaeia archaeon]
MLANGAERIIPVGSLEEAFRLKRINPGWILMGERDGRRVEGFDYGNSPYEVRDVDFTGKTVIQTTGAGTQGVVRASGAEGILLASFVTAGATIEHIKKTRPKLLSIVAMGNRGVEPSIEDELCADYIEMGLRGIKVDFEEMKRRIRASPSGAKFFDPTQPQYRPEDFYMALELDRFSFILKAFRENLLYVVKQPP